MDSHARAINASGNLLTESFSPECRSFLAERMLTKPIISGEVLYQADAPLLNLIFPHDGIISFQYVLNDGRTVEKLSVGKDGFVGVPFLFGETRFPCHAITVISGNASWISVHEFNDAMARFSCIQPALESYTMRVLKHLMQSVVCASVHSASQRIATWLLFADDRSQTSSFDITQRTLANIFGLRLATVGDACAKLGMAGAIDHSRGTMSIADRESLERQACECYQAVHT